MQHGSDAHRPPLSTQGTGRGHRGPRRTPGVRPRGRGRAGRQGDLRLRRRQRRPDRDLRGDLDPGHPAAAPPGRPGRGAGQRARQAPAGALGGRPRPRASGTSWRAGHERTSADSDHTVKVDVTGLRPTPATTTGSRAEGERSPVGRTRTAPDVPGDACTPCGSPWCRCSNYTGGYFTAYRASPQRDDLDLVLHVGDYIYEYGNGAGPLRPGRAGRRARRRSPTPRPSTSRATGCATRCTRPTRIPRRRTAHIPWITIFDDHEVANNAWANGAENHTPTRGAYLARRRRQAYEAYLEWMPFRLPDQSVPHQGTRFFKRFTFGALGDLSILETRQNRSQQVDVPGQCRSTASSRSGQPGRRRRPRRPDPPPARARAARLAQGRCRAAGPAVAPARQPGHDGAGRSTPGRRSGRRPHLRQRRPVGRLRRRPGEPARRTSRPCRPRRVTSSCSPATSTRPSSCEVPVDGVPGRVVHLGRRRVRLPVGHQRRLLRGARRHRRSSPGQPPEVVVAVTRQAIGAAQQLNPWLKYHRRRSATGSSSST